MTRLIAHTAFIFLLLWGVCGPLYAQSYLVNAREINTKDGLSHKGVRCITQDTCGFIWMGTHYGLNRYDGYEFKWFTKDRYPLSGNIISEILQGENGLFWVTHTEAVRPNTTYLYFDLFNPYTYEIRPWEEQMENAAPFALSEVLKVKSIPDGRLVFNLRNGEVYSYSLSSGFQKRPFPPGFTLHDCFEEDDIWGTTERNLLKIGWNGEIKNSYLLQEGAEVFQMTKDYPDRYWVVLANAIPDGSRGHYPPYIQVFEKGTMTSVDIGEPFYFTDLLIQPLPEKKGVLILHKREAFEFGPDLKLRYYLPTLPSNFGIGNGSSVYLDHNGLIWHGHREGLTLIDWRLSPFTPYLKNAFGSEIYQTRGIAVTGHKMLVASMVKSAVVDLQTGAISSFGGWAPGGSFRAWPLFVNVEGEIWGWALDQLCRMDSLGNLIESIPLPGEEEGVAQRVWGLMQDSHKTWWVGPFEGLVSYNKEKDERPQVFQKYNGFGILRKAAKWHFLDTDTGIWVCSERGLFFLDREKGITARFASDETGNRHLPTDRIIFAYKDDDGILWMATEDAGLLRVNEDELLNTSKDTALHVQQFTRVDGLPSNELYGIFEDNHQHLWIATANGLVQFNKKTFEIKSYFEEQGITNNEFNRISQFRDKSGRIYFGSLNGVTTFNPDDFYGLPSYDPGFKVSSVELFSGKADSLMDLTEGVLNGEPIVYRPGDKYLTLKLSLQDYFYADQLNYQYRIEGLNKEWTKAIGNQIQLSNLPYGKYTLQVQAQGPDKRFTAHELAIPLSFPKPFFLQNWFLISLLLAIGLSVWQINYWRIHALRKRQAQLEEMVRERTVKIREDKKLIEEQAEQLKELDQMKSRFFANISHELRTPLTLILGPLESVLKRNRLENRDFTYLKLMQQNGELLLKRINELLQLSRIEANKVKVETAPVTLYDFLKRILAGFEGGANLKEVSLLYDFQADRNLKVLLDTDKVEKIVTNYLSNAIKFTPKGGEIELKVKRQANRFQLSVRDTGIGIPPEDLEHVFDRFFQSSNNDQHGTGIGLSLCRELAQLMEGKVWVESIQGQGSTFYLALPLVETFAKEENLPTVTAEPVEEETPTAPAPEPDKGYGKYSILVVEDNASLREYISLILSDYRILPAEHGARALEILRDGTSVDLVLSDIMMPVMDGLELLETVKADDELCQIPMVMLTAKQSTDTKLKALRIGVDDYMVKPFKEDELLARVANLLRNRAGRTETSPAKTTGTDPTEAPTKVSAADLRWLEGIEQHIFKNLGNRSFNLSQLADDMLMSTRRLQQKIKDITGLTPKQYQREIQLEQARRLLESGEFQTVAEVSYKVGFEDPHYFSTLFQERYGKKPSEY